MHVERRRPLKLYEICKYMLQNGISICALQETRQPFSDDYSSDDGFNVILSGSCTPDQEWAGVGFAISPSLAPSVIGFRQLGSRLATLKVRV